MKKCWDYLNDETALSSQGDIAAFFIAVFWLKLHLFLVSAKDVPAVQRCVCLHLTLAWITNISDMSIAPKRNFLLESTSNMFLVLNSEITKLSGCSSEPAEHNFGMLRQRVRDFTMCQLVGLLDTVKRRNV